MQRMLWAVLTCVLIAVGACQKPSASELQTKAAPGRVEPRFPDEPPNVVFDIKLSADGRATGVQLYDCTYQSAGKTARFRLEWRQNGPLSGDIIPIAAAGGRFLAVEGSDRSVLLADLKKALEAKDFPRNVSRAKELPFDAVVLGDHQSRDAAGGMHDSPPGDWTILKLFLPKGGDDGEVFLHLNPVLGKAEFSIKDEEYGNYLLGQFAKVF